MEPDPLVPLPPPVFHILIALAEGERHGYAIMQDVAERSGGRLRMSPGTLYGSIKRMAEQGLIEEVWPRAAAPDEERRRYYRLTRLGRRTAEAEAARLSDLLKQARAHGLVPSRG
ncbi:MAG TPA: helix-turn-helix transcriptional regulator [Vicinamibacteria bacterium]|jgi:DNA-binding PadR family transcriptional regulator